jgi:hypothetical protein
MTIHLHHVHLNVADRERSVRFYEKFFTAKRVMPNGVSEALQVTRRCSCSTNAPRRRQQAAERAQHMGYSWTGCLVHGRDRRRRARHAASAVQHL